MWENWHLLWNLEVVIREIFLVCCMKLLSSVNLKAKSYFLLKWHLLYVILYIVKMGLIHHWSRVTKYTIQVLLAAKPGPLPAPFACILGEFCEMALMSRSPSDRMVRSGLVFSPFRAEPRHAGWSIPVPGGGGTAAEPPLRPLLAVGAKCSSCSARTFPGIQYTVLC